MSILNDFCFRSFDFEVRCPQSGEAVGAKAGHEKVEAIAAARIAAHGAKSGNGRQG